MANTRDRKDYALEFKAKVAMEAVAGWWTWAKEVRLWKCRNRGKLKDGFPTAPADNNKFKKTKRRKDRKSDHRFIAKKYHFMV